MLVDQHHIRELLARVVQRVTPNRLAHDDLMQEALIHLWRKELDHPGQTQSWYIQNCRFYLLNYLGRDRSLDSFQRWQARSLLDADSELSEDEGGGLPIDESMFTCVCARDIMELLLHRASPVDHSVLRDLADGFGVREIAERLNLSHQAVSKRRQRIAVLAMQLGIALAPNTQSESVSANP